MDGFRRELVALLPRLRRLAWVVARSDDDALELLHVTLERVLARQDSWEQGTRLDQWIFAIMKNIWVDEVRKRGRWDRLVQPLPEDDVIADDGNMAADIEHGLDLAAVREAVEELPEEQRLAVKLVLLENHSYSEAASLLDIPEGTLTSRLSRGRGALIARFLDVGDRDGQE